MNVLIVEDEIVARNALSSLLRGFGYTTRAFGSAESALKSLADGERPEVALIDLDLPGMNGADLISCLAAQRPEVSPILITAASCERIRSLGQGDVLHLRKPLDFQELLKVLEDFSRSHPAV